MARKQGFVWDWEAGDKKLGASADKVYMKTSVPRPRPEAMDTVDKNVITLWEKQLYKGEATIKA